MVFMVIEIVWVGFVILVILDLVLVVSFCGWWSFFYFVFVNSVFCLVENKGFVFCVVVVFWGWLVVKGFLIKIIMMGVVVIVVYFVKMVVDCKGCWWVIFGWEKGVIWLIWWLGSDGFGGGGGLGMIRILFFLLCGFDKCLIIFVE